jgi:single-stranded DNA-binding protein
MKNIAEFTIIGRVGSTKTLGKAVRVTIASNYRLKDERGAWREDTYWNEGTVFSPTSQAYIAEHITKGDLVHVRGRIRQNSYERNGSRVYTVDLVANSFSRLVQGSDRARTSEQAHEAQPA